MLFFWNELRWLRSSFISVFGFTCVLLNICSYLFWRCTGSMMFFICFKKSIAFCFIQSHLRGSHWGFNWLSSFFARKNYLDTTCCWKIIDMYAENLIYNSFCKQFPVDAENSTLNLTAHYFETTRFNLQDSPGCEALSEEKKIPQVAIQSFLWNNEDCRLNRLHRISHNISIIKAITFPRSLFSNFYPLVLTFELVW